MLGIFNEIKKFINFYFINNSIYFCSPEVWKDQPYDSKSDIWSLGCVLYEMITLRPPFRAENMEGLCNRVIKGKILIKLKCLVTLYYIRLNFIFSLYSYILNQINRSIQ